MRRWHMPRIPIFIKLMLAFMLVVIPLYALSIYLNNLGAGSVRDEIASSMKAKVHFYIQTLAVEFERIGGLQQELINDDDLGKLSVANQVLNDVQRTESILRVQSRLRLVKNSSNYIDSLNVFIPSIGKEIDSQNQYNDRSEDQLGPLIEATDLTFSPIVSWNDRIFINQKYPDAGNPNALTFFLNLELSKSAIRRELDQFVSMENERAVLFGSDLTWAIESEPDRELAEQLKSFARERIREESRFSAMDTFSYKGQPYIVTMEYSPEFDITLLMYIPEQAALGSLNKYKMWFWLLSVTSVLICLFFSYWIYRIIHRPLKRLVLSFRKVEKGNLEVKLEAASNDEFEYLYVQFNSMLNQLKIRIREAYEEKIRTQKAELKQLQAQINPHFLYNSFFILNRMVKVEDYPKLKPFTKHLGNYFKFITRNASDDVPLQEELEFARAYLEIQKIRFEDRIQVELGELPEAYARTRVPRLTLQPIIENSYKYGLEDSDDGGRLRIEFVPGDGMLAIHIEDNGKGMSDVEIWSLNRRLSDPQPEQESTGILNVHKRLQLKYGADSGIRVSTGGLLGGLRVSLYIPVKEE